MKKGYLSEFFSSAAIKTLSAVEADLVRSNQHEFNGVEALKKLFGEATGKQRYYSKFIYLTDDDDSEPIVSEGTLTWYDAREANPTRSEHRLYFPTTEVSSKAGPGDTMVIGLRQDGSVVVVVAEVGSTAANQIKWLFGFSDSVKEGFSVKAEAESDYVKLEFASKLILEQIGIVADEQNDNYLEVMLEKFGGIFPSTRVFSAFARSTVPHVDPRDNPDETLVEWMEREEQLFRTLEKHIVADRLVNGFISDVDSFLSFSLSVQNRRKSRVGHALENHLEEIFINHNVQYDRAKVTENKSKPDFLFPGITQYQNPDFDSLLLTMLGVKSTCKDRWRQVLAEADRIKQKHLLTLEPSISEAQTDEMQQKKLTLVLPKAIHSSYTTSQQTCLLSLDDFLCLIRSRQSFFMHSSKG